MKEKKWNEPDWNAFDPVEFEQDSMPSGSVFMAILLAGVLIALILTIWHMTG